MGQKILIILVVLAVLATGGFFYLNNQRPQENTTQENLATTTNQPDIPKMTVLATGLDTPWAIAFIPDGEILVTERAGRVRLIDSTGKLQEEPVAVLENVREISEGGLLGIALDPDFQSNNYVYLYYTYSSSLNNTLNRVVRMTYSGTRLTNETTIVDQIPGAPNHDGGKIKFGPDKFLYITTGDAQEPSKSQDRNSLAGKILRVTKDGQPAPGNPFNNLVYSMGHRNPQGIAWDSSGNLWETEHGPSGIQSGNDEINLIKPGQNYGWDIIQGNQTREGMVTPIRNSGITSTWAPGGTAFLDGSLYFGGLRGQALYQAVLSGTQVTDFKEHFKGELGRIREVIVGPDNLLYISTSNNDGRGSPKEGDDKIIKINPQKL